MRRLLAAIALTLAILGSAIAACGSGGEAEKARSDEMKRNNAGDPRPQPRSARKASKLPNIIFIYTDDQNLTDFTPETMPRTYELLADQGTTFKDYVVATPLCCPSRVTYLTGDYPHGTGVFANRGGYRLIEDKFNTLPVWLSNAGYRTAWVGKYLQAYDMYADRPYETAPPGIDIWHGTFEPRYYNYGIADGKGNADRRGTRPSDYYTNVVTDYATKTIRRELGGKRKRRPLYMTVNNLAPHTGAGQGGRCSDLVVPAPRDEDAFADATIPRTASYNEGDVSDKPPFVPSHTLRKDRVEKLDLAYGCRLASLQAVDRGVAEMYEAVKREGELDNTVFFFTSDNGILQGQHRLGGKNVPYEEGIRMPLVVFGGEDALGGSTVPEVSQLTANVDLAPTILELAKAQPCARPGNCRRPDGLSLLPLMRDGEARGFDDEREILIEGGKTRSDCLYAGVRTADLVYIEHAEAGAGACDRDAETELYDLSGALTGNADPGQLDNLTSETVPASQEQRVIQEVRRLARRTLALRRCDGKSCR